MEKLSKKKDITKIKNLWIKKGRKIYKNDVRSLIQNLDELPFEDYDFETQWILENGKLVKMSEKHLRQGEFNQIAYKKRILTEFGASSIFLIHTVRGCPYSCTFCCNHDLKKIYLDKGKFIRKKSIRYVIKQLEEIKQKFPSIDFIWFTDDTFFIRSIEELTLFTKEYKKKIGLPFMCYVSPLTFNEAKFKLLVDAGLRRINIGIQTGSEEINRKIYNRFITNKCFIDVLKIINKYKHKMILPECFIIIANPYESERDVLATINLLQELPKPYFLMVFNLVFFPGTRLYYKAMNDGIIKSKNSCYNINYLNYRENLIIKKLNTVYLNLILTMMRGKVTFSRYGLLPKLLLKLLLNKMVIRLFNKSKFLTRSLIKLSPVNYI